MPDKDIRIEISTASDDGRIADHFGRRLERAEMTNDLQICFKRLVDHEQSLAWRHFHEFVDNDEGGGTPETGVVIFGMIYKYEIALLDLWSSLMPVAWPFLLPTNSAPRKSASH
jgi:hypothetical protein